MPINLFLFFLFSQHAIGFDPWPLALPGSNFGFFTPDGSRVVAAAGGSVIAIDVVTGEQIHVFGGHLPSSSVVDASLSPDGSKLLSVGSQGLALVFDYRTQLALYNVSIPGGFTPLHVGSFSPNGQLALIAGTNYNVLIFNVSSGKQVHLLVGGAVDVTVAKFSPDGQTVLTLGNDRTVRLYNVSTGQLGLAIPLIHGSPSASFSPDGQRIAVGHSTGNTSVFAVNGSLLLTLTGHTDQVNTAVFSHDSNGTFILTASSDSTARLFNSFSGAQVALYSGHTATVTSANFSPDDRLVITASTDNSARVFQADTGVPRTVLTGHTKPVHSAQFNTENSMVLTCGADNSCRLYDIVGGNYIRTLGRHEFVVNEAAFSPDGVTLVTTSLLFLRTFCIDGFNNLTISFQEVVAHPVFSPDGSLLAVLGQSTVYVTDAAGNKVLDYIFGKNDATTVLSAVFSKNGTLLLIAGTGGVHLVQISSGKLVRHYANYTTEVYGPASFSPDERFVLSACRGNTAVVFDMERGDPLFSLLGHTNTIVQAKYSPRGSLIATSSFDTTVRLWDATNGAEVLVLTGHKRTVNALQFSPDGTKLLSGSWDATARVWDVKTGQQTAIFEEHTAVINSVSFSPDGTQGLTASNDLTARVFDIFSGVQMDVLSGHSDKVNTAVFSPDGRMVVTASDDKSARLWYSTYLGDFYGCTRYGFLFFGCKQLETLFINGLPPGFGFIPLIPSPDTTGSPSPESTPVCQGAADTGCTIFVPAGIVGLYTIPVQAPLQPMFNFSSSPFLEVTTVGNGRVIAVSNGRQALNCTACYHTAYPLLADFSLTTVADPGSIFVGWSADPVPPDFHCDTDAYCHVPPGPSNVSLIATFAIKPGHLTVTSSGSGTGNIVGYSDDDLILQCGSICTAPLLSTVNLTTEAGPASYFAGWVNCPEANTGGCTVPAGNESVQVQARFEKGQLLLARQPVSSVSTRAPFVGAIEIHFVDSSATQRPLPQPLLLTLDILPAPVTGQLGVTTLLGVDGSAMFSGITLSGRFGENYSIIVSENTGLLDSIVSHQVFMDNCLAEEFANQTSWQCQACSDTFQCVNCSLPGLRCNSTVHQVVSPGNWRCSPSSEFVYPCYGLCEVDSTGSCLAGGAGWACGGCQPGFSSWAGRCTSCWPSWLGIPALLLLAIGLTALTLVFITIQTDPNRTETALSMSLQASHARNWRVDVGITVPLKQLIHFLQTLAQLKALRIRMHWAVQGVFSLTDVVRSGIVALPLFHCYLNLTPAQWMIVTAVGIPVGCLTISIGLHFYRRHVAKAQKISVLGVWRFIAVLLVTLLLSSTFCVGLALSSFACADFNCGSRTSFTQTSVLRSDMKTPCDGKEYGDLVFVATWSAVAHGAFLPLVGLGLVWLCRRVLGKPMGRNIFHFCCGGYRDRCWWWEWAQLLRKLGITLVVVLFSDPIVQVALCLVVVHIHLWLMISQRPFQDRDRYILEQRSCAVMQVMLVLFLLLPACTSAAQSLVVNMLIFLLQLTALGLFLWEFQRRVWPYVSCRKCMDAQEPTSPEVLVSESPLSVSLLSGTNSKN